MNLQLARHVLEQLHAAGVREAVVCAGARNAPFVHLLSRQSSWAVTSFFEERSAAFFALGRILSQGRPVAVFTTSGTAVAECLSACIEADYSHLPLMIVSSDRPRRYRGVGAPQAIEQAGLFSVYVESSVDVEGPLDLGWREWTGRRPVHINVCFDEPLLSGSAALEFAAREGQFQPRLPRPSATALEQVEEWASSVRRPLLVLSRMPASMRQVVRPFVERWLGPVLCEAPSGFLDETRDRAVLNLPLVERVSPFDGVLRIGGVPTHRLWRDLEISKAHWPVLNVDDGRFSGLPRLAGSPLPSHQFIEHSARVLEFTDAPEAPVVEELRRQRHRLEEVLNRWPRSEPALVRMISQWVGAQHRVFLGNSLPIREWDAFSRTQRAGVEYFANRGVNGIDGLISTAAGLCEPGNTVWAIVGDLSALYDMAGFWALRDRSFQASLKVVVINNGGGMIFRPIFKDPAFENAHSLRFDALAEFWSLPYRRVQAHGDFVPREGSELIEVIPDATHTQGFLKDWDSP
jgi:2-succinyl-5-enolpyruvyl-6-hydroxy-3-cyclohexene-1-carboxylate synthase